MASSFLFFKKNPPERVLNGLQPREGWGEGDIVSPFEGQKNLSEVNVLSREQNGY